MDWNKRGLFTTAGNAWQPNAISQALRSPRVAGLRQHDGELHRATWEPVFAEAEWYRLQQALEPNRTRRRAQRRSVARHLLTGLAVCSECGSPMRAQQDAGSGKLRYACRFDTGCGKVSILAVETEEAVIEMVTSVVNDQRLTQVMRTGEQEAERQEIEAKLVASREALVEFGTLYFQERAITKLEYLSQRFPLAESINKLEERLRGLRAEPKLGDLPTTAEELRVALADTGVAVAERRRLLDLLLERVEVRPVQRRGYPRFDVGRLWLVWRA